MQEARAAPFGAASATAGAWSSEQAHGTGDVRAHAFGTASVLGPEGSSDDTPGASANSSKAMCGAASIPRGRANNLAAGAVSGKDKSGRGE